MGNRQYSYTTYRLSKYTYKKIFYLHLFVKLETVFLIVDLF